MTKFLCGECIHNSDKGGGCLIPKNLGYVDNCNRYLPKDKPIVLTNEEWIQTCNTEQLVHVIHLMTTSCYVCGSDGVDYRRCYFRKQCTGPKEIEEWLKEPHPKWS